MSDIKASVQGFMDGIADYAVLDPEWPNDERQLYLCWGIKGVGFGMLCFFDEDGELTCDNECMSRKTCKRILDRLVDELPGRDALPPLLARFQTVDALLDASTPRNPGPDWPSK